MTDYDMRQATDLVPLGRMCRAGQSVIKVICGIILPPLGWVRQSLVGVLDLLEMFLDLLLLALVSYCCACLVGMVFQSSLPVSCSTTEAG